jgi:NAD(P)-dependent dehydrogenase (short-subunit alcohol dehydrogenase family)
MANVAQPLGAAAITGAGGGLGREVGLKPANDGYRIFGTALSQQEGHGSSRGFTQALGESGPDVLMSNARILTPGPPEVLPVAAIRHEFEVNIFAGLAVINAFLPALRRARGRIVQIGAMTVRLPLPFNGPSTAPKAALEAFADAYRTELKAWAPSSSRMVDAAWPVRRRPTVSDQSMWRVYSSERHQDLAGRS